MRPHRAPRTSAEAGGTMSSNSVLWQPSYADTILIALAQGSGEHDPPIQGNRLEGDVPGIICREPSGVAHVYAVHLSKTGYAGLDFKHARLFTGPDQRRLAGQARPRPDQTQLAPK